MLVIGGLMMGTHTDNLDTPITKTSTGVVVLPRSHHVIERKLKPGKAQAAIGKSACDQCRYCTEFCPRFLLGYAVEPHQVMRTLAFTGTGADYFNQWAAMCCSCGLAPFTLPRGIVSQGSLRRRQVRHAPEKCEWNRPTPDIKPHGMRDGRHVPIKTLTRKLHVEKYDLPAPLYSGKIEPSRLVIPLKQSAGTPCLPKVKVGDRVSAGQIIGEPAPNQMGAILHAPLAGRISRRHRTTNHFGKIILWPKNPLA